MTTFANPEEPLYHLGDTLLFTPDNTIGECVVVAPQPNGGWMYGCKTDGQPLWYAREDLLMKV